VDVLRVWIVVLALVSFAAGGVGGLLVNRRCPDDYGPQGHFRDYHRHFVEQFDLSPERSRLLAQLLSQYEQDFEDVRQRALERSRSEMEPELVVLANRYRGIIRNNVLPPEQREQFTEYALSEPWSPLPQAAR